MGGQRLHHASSRLSSITSSSGHVIASGDQGSSSAVPVISAISECGLRNAMPAQTPSAAVAAAEDVRQPLAQPSLDAARRHQHEFLGEWVGQRIGQQCAETVSKQVGALGTVEVEGHRPQR